MVTVAYAPTDVTNKHMKDEYCSLLQSVLENFSLHDISIILTDASVVIASVLCDPQLYLHITGTVCIDPA